MRLKGLELQGFKSFADRTVLDFENGITAVVGPNGSGKSNISDAMRWVMGEQSAKSLRGGSMQDVIFSGTQKRKPLGYAEVSLIIDNSDKKLPVDFEEVVVTRRLFRSGESEYYINKSSVRLRDIHELFMDTGVGRDGYSIIGQGKIAEIVNTKSDDRRTMFEEAAGITKFRYRKEEAERKLSHTNDNVTRVNDIISEIEGQIGPLKVQSEKAKKYLNLRDKLKVLEVNVSLKNIVKYRKLIEEVAGQMETLNAQLTDINNKIEENERQTEQIFNNISEAEKFAEENRNKQQISIQTLSEYKSDIEVLKSKIDGNNDNIKRIKSEIEELNAKFDEIEKSVMDEEIGFNELKDREKALNDNARELEQKLLDFDRESAKDNEDINSINTEIIENMNTVANIRSKISNCKALIQSYEERAETVKRELSDKKGDIERLCFNVDELEKDYNNLNNDHSELKNKLDVERTEYLKLVSECNEAEEELHKTKNNLEQSISRQKLLKDMEKSFDNYSRSVKAVMNEFSNGNLKGVKLYGTVAGLVDVSKEYSTAIEIALGASAQYIVTETEEDAKKSIEFLKRTKQGRATFLPVSAAKNSDFKEKGIETCKGYIGIASELIDYDKKYDAVISGLLGRVVVVDNIDNAVALSRKYSYKFRVVTLSGELLAPGGSMSGGSKNNTNGIFARSNEIIELEDIIKDLTTKSNELENKYIKLNSIVEQKKAYVETLQEDVSVKNNELIKIQSDLTHYNTFKESLIEGQKAMNNELTQLEVQVEDMEKQITLYESEIETVNSKIAAFEKEIDLKRERLGIDLKSREEIVEKIGNIKIELNTVLKDVEMYNQRISMVNLRKQEITVNISQKEKNIEEINGVNDDINEDIDFKTEQIESINEEIASLNEIIKNSEDARKEAQESIKKQQEINKKLRDNQLVVQQEQSRVESKKTKTDVELENIINKLWEDYELTITTAEELRAEIPDNAVRQINDIKAEIKGLGNINIDAIEEYNQVGERYEFLKTQRDDLVEAQNNLQQVIEDMVMIMKQQFSEKFAVINKHFGNTFVQLFGGGKAELVLTEPKDVLNSGVEINVQPPGKAVKSMMQLSGGEQAFVSIALLFAILKVRPAPFCVLDEIEAALDDVNVVRFADYLKKFSNDSQFIVVTHRRGTMEAANILYGVTMQEQGVSRLLSLNIDDVVDMNIK